MYAAVYLNVSEAMNVQVGLSSDDSSQVLLDGDEIFIKSVVSRLFGRLGVRDVSDTTPLDAGAHLLVVKVFDWCGETHHLRLRFQNPETGEPLTEKDGLRVCLDPEECGFPPED